MKIIDENKLMGSPHLLINHKQDDDYKKKIMIVLQKRIKNISNGQKILLLKKKKNPFHIINKTQNNKNNDFEIFYQIWKSIIVKKIKREEIEEIEFNTKDKKIKNLGYVAKDISEINSSDPRLLLLWNYNPKIRAVVWFKNQKIGTYIKSDFLNEFESFDIARRKDWKRFLYFFPTIKNPQIKGMGWKSLVREMKDMDQKRDNQIRLRHIEDLIREMA